MSYNRNYNNNNNNKHKDGSFIKTSGAKYKDIKEGFFKGFPFVSAWKRAKGGLITASCFPRALKSGSVGDKNRQPSDRVAFEVEVEDPNNPQRTIVKTYARYRVDVKQGINVQTYYCFMNLETKKIVIKELGLVISPTGSGKTRSGKSVSGYFGRNYKK